MNDEGGEYCLPGYMRDRLMTSYEGERDFYQKKLESADGDVDVEDLENFKAKMSEAETNLRTVEEMAVCDIHADDIDVPAVTETVPEPTSESNPDPGPLSAADD